jgi:phage regulator Rha-like protein
VDRFPVNFMFQINGEEYESLRSQFVTLKRGQHKKYLPYVFTEHGVVMLSSVLKSKKAVQVSIAVVNAFIKMREYLATHKQILDKLKKHDENFVLIFDFLKKLANKPKEPVKQKQIGFRPNDEI